MIVNKAGEIYSSLGSVLLGGGRDENPPPSLKLGVIIDVLTNEM